MSKVIKRKNAYGMGGTFDHPGYEYDPVNDTFKDLETGKIFSKDGGTTDEKIEANKETNIDVSQYTAPVEIKPTIGNDAMKKTTVTLNNIPVASDIEANKTASIDVSAYTEPVEITPSAGKDAMEKVTITLSDIPAGINMLYAWKPSSAGTGEYRNSRVYSVKENPEVGDNILDINVYLGNHLTYNMTVVSVEGDTLKYMNGPSELTAYRSSTDNITL